jgi:Protein of unknown function (DUF1592)/Protein of unknown function (DUF1588)/Protein of unknown function (DUF1587)/Protein of unknown function (DUF1595)/Protein of unknown function (DUF1585)/Planctomycete cytochrome C
VAADLTVGSATFKQHVAPFLQQYCIRCHGAEKSKGKLNVQDLNADFSAHNSEAAWESILNMLELGEMPPADENQPNAEQTKAVMQWIRTRLREQVEKGEPLENQSKTRRLTNVEYQNTLSDLLGFELHVIDQLSEDPEHAYHFNNTAELMRIGPEQLERYLEVARKAMREAIVDPEQPSPFKWRGEWTSAGSERGAGQDEVHAFGGNRDFSGGIRLAGFPEYGEYRIRMSASAILPVGHSETPLRLNMGAHQGGEHNEKPSRDIGTIYLTNGPDEPKIFEFRGRMQNHPYSVELEEKGAKRGQNLAMMSLRLRVDYDDGTLNDGGIYKVTNALATPRAVVNWIEFESPIVDTWPPQHHTNILLASPLRASDEAAYVRAVLKRFMSFAYRRPTTDTEVERYAKIYHLVRPTVDTLEQAMRETLAMVLVSPRFLYHTESDSEMDKQFAMASRLSYFLWASMPDLQLFRLASQKKLDDPAVIEQQVLRMLADKRAEKFIEDFTMQWLSIEKMLTVPINKQLYPRFLNLVPIGETAGTEMPYQISVRDYMLQETVGFVGHLIRENKSVLNVVDSDFAFLNERLAVHYGVEGVKGMQMRIVPIKPEHHLGGLLTQGSVLIGNGTGTAPHPIYRAVWLREAILGDKVAPPPSEVPALSDSAGASLEKALSIAELLAKHRTVESCNDCHFRLDPWGIPFEQYNAIGKFQLKVPKDGTHVFGFDLTRHVDLAGYQKYLDSINTVEVDAKARVPHGPEVDGMRELKAYLLRERKDDIAQNVIKRLLTYGIGRHLTVRDRFAVDELFQQAASNGLGMRDMIVSICKSNVFRESNSKREQ